MAIVGLGYVGLPLAVLADQKGYPTIGVDTDAAKVAQLTRREAPFADPALRDALRRALTFYRMLLDAEVKPMGSLKEAEAVKVVENAFRDINIAFVNELAMSFAKLGIDVVNVIDGAATKPFAFMPHYPGCGVGGHCIPVDPYYLIDYAKKNGFQHDFLALARRINNNMPVYTADLVAQALGKKHIPLKGSKVAVLGLAYKPDIDDCRESPAFEIVAELKRRGAEVVTYDPFVPEKSTAPSLDSAMHGAHAVVIATAHEVFRVLRPTDFVRYHIQAVIDGRNCLDKQAFAGTDLTYIGVGRATV